MWNKSDFTTVGCAAKPETGPECCREVFKTVVVN